MRENSNSRSGGDRDYKITRARFIQSDIVADRPASEHRGQHCVRQIVRQQRRQSASHLEPSELVPNSRESRSIESAQRADEKLTRTGQK